MATSSAPHVGGDTTRELPQNPEIPPAAPMTRHPLSELSGPMDQSTYDALVEHVSRSDDPPTVVVYRGMVVDCWYTYKACLDTGVSPKEVAYKGGDPSAYVVRRNLLRRHLSKGQRAMSIVCLYSWRESGRPQKGTETAPFLDEAKPKKSVAEMAGEAAVSETSINKAKAVYRAVLNGEVLSSRKSLDETYSEILKEAKDQIAPYSSDKLPQRAESARSLSKDSISNTIIVGNRSGVY